MISTRHFPQLPFLQLNLGVKPMLSAVSNKEPFSIAQNAEVLDLWKTIFIVCDTGESVFILLANSKIPCPKMANIYDDAFDRPLWWFSLHGEARKSFIATIKKVLWCGEINLEKEWQKINTVSGFWSQAWNQNYFWNSWAENYVNQIMYIEME